MANVKEVTWNETAKTAEFIMDITRDSTGGSPTHRVRCTVQCTDMTTQDCAIVAFSGSTFRVRLQARLRTLTEQQLRGYAANGYTCNWRDLLTKMERHEVSVQDRLMLLSMPDFIDLMVKDLGIDAEQATVIYNRKHGITK